MIDQKYMDNISDNLIELISICKSMSKHFDNKTEQHKVIKKFIKATINEEKNMAIKCFKELTNVRLRDAKEVVEDIMPEIIGGNK